MSFGGGFGSNTGGGFGGFGQNNTNNATSRSSLFGGNTATSGGFGGFGNNNASNNTFGAKTGGFGAPATSTGGSLFGGGPSTTGGFSGSGFGANNNATPGATLSTSFGSNTGNTTSLFGAKPATGFGSTNTGGSLFGGNNSGGFGTNNATSTFGANAAPSTGFGASSSNTGGFGTANNTSSFGGFGGAGASATPGTAATPFTPFTEKDSPAGNTTSAYHSITMQQPYAGKSFEELRLEDYAANKRYPSQNSFGTTGSFGAGFGGNNTNTATAARPSLFGSATGSAGFGASNTTSFGGNNNTTTSGGLFGAKPAATNLFGGTNTTANITTGFGGTSTTGGGVFGNNNATNNASGFGFGTNASNNTQQTGGLFGNNNANAAKSGSFGFGNNTVTTTTTANPFGGGGFGTNQNNTTQPTGGLFGNNANSTSFGTNNTSGGLFGNTAAKPAGTGLFGNTNTAANTSAGGGLFGTANTNNNAFGGSSSGGLFGASNTNNTTSGGLFGQQSNAAKPTGGLFGATPANNSGGLFGQSAANNTTGGGSLFGGGATSTGGGLFGNTAAKPTGGLFGNSTGTGGSLFGNTNTNTGGLFGNNAQPAAGGGLFGSQQGGSSLFGNTAGPQQSQLTASITGDPYGNAQLFASLASPSPPVGPLATPLSGARPVPKARASLLASVRGGSPMLGASTSVTPRGRPGYGFSYSNYNSPLNGTPVLTPGATSLLRPTGSLGSALSSRLSKSFSTSNLRGELGDGQSLLRTPAPGQGSLLLGSSSLGSGSVRRLKIDRSLRTDLFGDTPKKIETAKDSEKEPELRKRVSFDKSAEKDASTPAAKPSASNALVVRDEEETSTPKAPEMSQINNGPSLTTVHEEAASDKPASPLRTPETGDYFTEPPIKQLKSMSRSQLAQLKSFTVGRQGVGKIEFGRSGPVDLSSVPLDDICGKIVQLKARSATVYEDDASKPPVGKGLNLPSTISLEQSWPRSARQSSATQKTDAKDIERHKSRLRRVGGTKFLDYNDETGIWSFTVEHFTTYELDDDDETTMHDTTQENVQNSAKSFDSEQSLESPDLGDQDDTFQFKLARRSQQSNLSLPGGFEDSMALTNYDHDASADEMQDDFVQRGGLGDSALIDPFLEEADAVQSPDPDFQVEFHNEIPNYHNEEEEQELPGSFHADPNALKSILKPSAFDEDLFGPDDIIDLTWEDQLQRTLSPRKRDRQALRDGQTTAVTQADSDLLKKSLLTRSQLDGKQKSKGLVHGIQQSEAFKTSMDIMKSLWADDNGAAKPQLAVQSFNSTRSPVSDTASLTRAFKPTFTKNEGVLVAGASATSKQSSDINVALRPGGLRDVKVMQSGAVEDNNTSALIKLQQSEENTTIEADDMDMDEDDEEELPNMPSAMTSNRVMFKSIADSVNVVSEAAEHEKDIWDLCSVLFDSLEVCATAQIQGLQDNVVDELQSQIRKDVFLELWSRFIERQTSIQLQRATSSEEKALLYLCSGNVFAASEVLMEDNNTRLALIVSQLPGSEPNRELIRQQLDVWLTRKDWSEFSDGQRALYSILSGSTSHVVGNEKAAAEDKVAGFCISRKYNLDWKQSLALKVRYGGEETFQASIKAYVEDLEAGVELAKPVPWHQSSVDAEDTLLSLLKLITEQASVEDMLDATVVSGNGFYNRLVWQLATLLAARGILQPSDEQMDSLTMNLAAELDSAGEFMESLWVLLHLNENDSRYTAIKATLERNSAEISGPGDERGVFEQITQTLLIPATMVWAAKALHAGGDLEDPVLQCEYLLRSASSDSYQEAHEVLCSKVGPQGVIEQYYTDLSRLIEQFSDIGAAHFEGWASGGQLYLYLCQLVHLPASKSHSKEAETLLKKLDQSLEAQREAGQQGLSLEMRVARIEMRKVVSERVKQFDNVDKWYSGATTSVARNNNAIGMLEKYMQALGEVH